MPVQSLAVFCGSRSGNNPLFTEHAKQLGAAMALLDIRLVYGGGSVGLMGTIADAVMENGGMVTGVIPEVLLSWERQHKGITNLIVVPDMHVRKRQMYEQCDAAVILPGGFGTLDEMFEMLTWNHLSIHDKHIYVLNTAGFYDHLEAHVRKMQEEDFLYELGIRRLKFATDPSTLMDMIRLHE